MCASSHVATSPCGSDKHSLMWFQSMDCDCTTVFHSVLCYAGVPRVAKIPVKRTEGYVCLSIFAVCCPCKSDVTSKQWIATVQPCFTLESVMHVCLELRHCLAGHDQRDAELYELMMCGRHCLAGHDQRDAELYELMMCGRHCLAGHDQRDAELYELMMCGRAMESSMWFRLAPKVWKAVRVTVDC